MKTTLLGMVVIVGIVVLAVLGLVALNDRREKAIQQNN
jgi:hypothetical protein